MSFRLTTALLLTALLLGGCGTREPESPAQALRAISMLYQTRDFDALVRTRYAEISKAENEEQIRALIARIETRFQDMDEYAQVHELLKEAMDAEPEISADGNVATYRLGDNRLKLSRMPNGNWGFHI